MRIPSFQAIHKGSHGRVVAIGGSPYYAGAPYFAAMAALRTGCDLVTVLTHPDAVIPIKTYSPDIITSPTSCHIAF